MIIGIICILLSSLCANFSVLLEKKGFLSEPDIPNLDLKLGLKQNIKIFIKLSKNKFWLLGFSLGIIKWLPYIIALSLVGIIITQPIMSVGLIVLVIFANFNLNEKLNNLEKISIFFLIISPILISIAGVSNYEIDTDLIISQYFIFLILNLIFVIVVYIISKFIKSEEHKAIFYSLNGGLLYSVGIIFVNIFSVLVFTSNILNIFSLSEWLNIIFGFLLADINYFIASLSFWVSIPCILLGLYLSQCAIQRGRATIVYPVYNIIRIILPVIIGIIIFNAYFESVLLFYAGVLLSVFAIVILSKITPKILSYGED